MARVVCAHCLKKRNQSKRVGKRESQLVSNSKDLDMGLQSDGQVVSDGLEKDPGCGDATGT